MRLVRSVRMLLPALALALPASAAPGCVASTGAHGIALDDPLGLVMDVARAGNPLRVYVLPASSYACDGTTGTIAPDIEDLEPGMVADAVVDINADISGDMATAMATIPTGDWTVLVRGKGTDPVSGRPNRIIATGCATVLGLAASETRQVNITLLPQHDMGMCNDGVLSPDEQCDVPGTMMCDASCHTTPIPVNVNVTAGTQSGVRAASSTGQNIVLTFDSRDTNDVGLRLLDVNGNMVGSAGTSLARDETIDSLPMPLPGPQASGRPAMAGNGRFVVALQNFFGGMNVQVAFFDATRNPTATTPARSPAAGMQTAPDAAFAGNRALLVVYQDDQSATGVAGTFFAPDATTPLMQGVALGNGLSGATHPSVAGLASGFVVVFAAGSDVYYQRYGADGSAMDASPVAVLDAADAMDTQDEPVVAANADGSFLVAWTEHSVALGDQMGTSIRARAFTATGPAGPALVLPVASAAGDQSAPTVAAADGRYVVAWAGSGVHARFVSGTGTALPNREQPQTAADFTVAAAGNAPSACAMGTTPASWLIAYDDGADAFARRYPR